MSAVRKILFIGLFIVIIVPVLGSNLVANTSAYLRFGNSFCWLEPNHDRLPHQFGGGVPSMTLSLKKMRYVPFWIRPSTLVGQTTRVLHFGVAVPNQEGPERGAVYGWSYREFGFLEFEPGNNNSYIGSYSWPSDCKRLLNLASDQGDR